MTLHEASILSSLRNTISKKREKPVRGNALNREPCNTIFDPYEKTVIENVPDQDLYHITLKQCEISVLKHEPDHESCDAILKQKEETVHADDLIQEPTFCGVDDLPICCNTTSKLAEKNAENDKTILCAACGLSFTRNSNLKRHEKTIHGNDQKPILCAACGLSFSSNYSLKRHESSVHGIDQKTFKCNICKLPFTQPHTLKRHKERVHKPGDHQTVKRDFCPRSYSHIKSVRLRKQAGKGSKKRRKFNCSCGKVFTFQSSLIRHVKTIHGEETVLENNVIRSIVNYYECSECKKSFNQKNNLKQHILRLHSSEAISFFECDTCGKRYKHKQDLVPHVKVHTDLHIHNDVEPKIACRLCSTFVYTRSEVLQHYKKHHSETVLTETIRFQTEVEFYEWKKSVETLSKFRFQKRSSHKHLKKYTSTTFVCHRSGFYNLKSDNRMKKIKRGGSIKLNAICPAAIYLRTNKLDHTCTVQYTSTHLWHSVDNEVEAIDNYVNRDDHVGLESVIAADDVPTERIIEGRQIEAGIQIEENDADPIRAYKEKLMREFVKSLENVDSLEDLELIRSAIVPLRPALASTCGNAR